MPVYVLCVTPHPYNVVVVVTFADSRPNTMLKISSMTRAGNNLWLDATGVIWHQPSGEVPKEQIASYAPVCMTSSLVAGTETTSNRYSSTNSALEENFLTYHLNTFADTYQNMLASL